MFPDEDFNSQPVASTSQHRFQSSTSFDLALDPSLTQASASGSGRRRADSSGADDDSVDEDDDSQEEDDDDEDESETDAEEEYRATQTQGGVKRKKGGMVAGLTEVLEDTSVGKGKGKGKAGEAGEGAGGYEDDGEELG